MKISKKIARGLLFPAMMNLGFDKLIRNQSNRTLLNIMYHGVVSNDSTYFSPRHIHKDNFERQLVYFKDNFDIISIPEAFYCVNNNIKLKRKTLTISFDDGFQNNLHTALPLLEKYNIKTSFFVSSIICTKDNPSTYLWSELIAALKYFNKNHIIQLDNLEFKDFYNSEINMSLTDLLKSCPHEKREEYIEELIQKYNLIANLKTIPSEIWKLMTKDEVRHLSSSEIIDIGSHGHLHYNLGNIDISKAKIELQKSKLLLEETIDKEINSIAYPDGSYNNEVKNAAEDIGYLYQLAVKYKEETDIGDVRILNRHGISSTTTFESNMIFLNSAFKSKGI